MAAEESRLPDVLARIAPGTGLRDGLERILRGRTGALVVLGHDETVDALSTGGFEIDVPFTATALRELAKMDGAIVLAADESRIIRAATHLMPDYRISSTETGTRHRTADRVAQQTGHPVITVSQSMQTIAVYVDGERYVVEGSEQVLARANQAVATLERYRSRLDEVTASLSALEIEDLVTLRDVAVVAQRQEMVARIAHEVENHVRELGTDGRLLSLQLEELVSGLAEDRLRVLCDYQETDGAGSASAALQKLESLPASDLVDVASVVRTLGIGDPGHLDQPASPRGYRLLARVPRLPATVVERLVEHFGTLQQLLAATNEQLLEVDGVGDQRARSVREGLSRLAESSILDRY